MIRNVVLLISSIAFLLVLFFGYSRIVTDPHVDEAGSNSDTVQIPSAVNSGGADSLRVGDVTIQPGGEFNFTRYDPQTGRPKDRIRGAEWKPVPGARDEIFVIKPELTIMLPSGMLATISADEAQLRVDRVNNKRADPKLGWLNKNVIIQIDRESSEQRTPLATRLQDRILITMPKMDFDLELGRLSTDGVVQVKNVAFEIAGTGLSLEWNQASNRVENLLLRTGDELVLYGGAGLFGDAAPDQAVPASAPADAAADAAATSAPAERLRKPRRPTAYDFSLTEGIQVTQYGDDNMPIGGLTAKSLSILFDVGAGADLFERSGATSRRTDGGRMVVKWGGPLRLGPTELPPNLKRPRRQFAAQGPVTLWRGDASILCDRLEYFDETQQIWLHAPRDGRIDLDFGPDLAASAGSVYIDRAANLVKLLDDVRLESKKTATAGGADKSTSIHAAHWAELYLSRDATPVIDAPSATAATMPIAGGVGYAVDPTTQPVDARPPQTRSARAAKKRVEDPLVGSGALERAVFVGAVDVQLSDQRLRAERLETTFRPRCPDESFEATLETALASGDAILTSRNESLKAAEVRVTFANTVQNALFPQQVDAIGGVVIQQQESRVQGERIYATLEAPRPNMASAFLLRDIQISGRAYLASRSAGGVSGNSGGMSGRVSARGERIEAALAGENELRRAVVCGNDDRNGRVRSGSYTVYGRDIVIEPPTQELRVDGASRLVMRTQRGIEGERRERREPITITASQAMHIAGGNNLVTFTGAVTARSGLEYMLADSMALTLEDSTTPPAPPAKGVLDPLLAVWTSARNEMQRVGVLGPEPKPAIVATTVRMTPKEPLRLTATSATVVSETPDPEGGLALTHASIAAPRLDIEIPERIIRTTGKTALLMTNRRMGDDSAAEHEALGVPSALMSRGPSQTAMQAESGMTYAIGKENADTGARQDSVLFEGGVTFVHRAGSEMVNLEQMMPQLAADKEALAKLRSRATYMECKRLECTFASASSAGARDAGGLSGGALGGGGAPLRLAWLMAKDNVYLRDRQGPGIREVHASRMEFDRARSIVGVFGEKNLPARVEYLNLQANRYDEPAVGPSFEIDLNNNTLRAGEVHGQFSRP